MKATFGEDLFLVHSSGVPLPTDEFGFLMHSLQHGEAYFLVIIQSQIYKHGFVVVLLFLLLIEILVNYFITLFVSEQTYFFLFCLLCLSLPHFGVENRK